MYKMLSFLLLGAILNGCGVEAPNQAQAITDQAIAAHGHALLMDKTVSFSFRDKNYSVTRSPGKYTYTRTSTNTRPEIVDVLINSTDFTRLIGGDTVAVADSMQTKYTNSVNSVLYFVQLPYLLNDPAAIKTYEGKKSIRGAEYDVLKVTFQASGGGNDYEDEYRYWIHRDTHTIDYMAYSYQTEGGGVRFREAYNRSRRNGILFQDYINYEVPTGTPLAKIPAMYEAGQLQELSRIVNKNIQVEKAP